MLIWITWTIWSGKWVVVDYLVEKYWFTHYSVRNYLAVILESQWLPVIRDNTTPLANSIRKKHWWGYIVDQLIEQATVETDKAVVESIRTLDEVNLLKAKGGMLLGVNADQNTRYHRVVDRKSTTDRVTFEQFVQDEYTEGHSKNPAVQNIFACLPLCDQIFLNEWTLDELYTQLDTYFESLNLTV